MMHRTQTHMATRTVDITVEGRSQTITISSNQAHINALFYISNPKLNNCRANYYNQHISSLFPIVKCYRKRLMFTVTRVLFGFFWRGGGGGVGGGGNVYCHPGFVFCSCLFIY